MPELAIERQIELTHQLLLEVAVPLRIEGAHVIKEAADGHAARQLLVL